MPDVWNNGKVLGYDRFDGEGQVIDDCGVYFTVYRRHIVPCGRYYLEEGEFIEFTTDKTHHIERIRLKVT